MPHHLGLFGGTSFRTLDQRAQPVIEMTSEHGQFETQFWLNLRANHLHPGVIAGGDDHTARPGLEGIAGVWMEVSGPGSEISKPPHRRAIGAASAPLFRRARTRPPDVQLDGVEPGGTLVRTAGDTRQSARRCASPTFRTAKAAAARQ